MMEEYFRNIVDLKFTANMETDLDKIEAGKMAWKDVLREYYKDFDANLNNAEIQLEGKHLKVPDEESDEVCPNCGRKLVYKNGRFGRFLACPGYPECSFTMPIVVEMPGKCPKCGGHMTQDPDTLDTWFSSALWPFSTLGWPDKDAKDLQYWYPTSVLVTGYDIIFFWVARMIMAGYEYRGEKPFGHVYFTGIVRDKIGRKMSKQLGNSPDPLDLIAQFGADGMRVAMLLSSSAGNDVMFDEALCEQGRNFGNKIWNAYRLVNGWTIDDTLAQSENNRLAIEWFRQALAKTLRQVESDFASYRISEAFMNLYKLFWDDFSGWYLEMIKPAYQCPIDRPTLEATCGFFDDLLRLLHPFMPFVTEEIWQDLAPRAEGASICVAQMPEPAAEDAAMLARFELAKET